MNLKSARSVNILLVFLIALASLAACGSEESDRTFAPETGGDSGLPTDTPVATNTSEPLDRQPGESASNTTSSGDSFKETGAVSALTAGLDRVSIVTLGSDKPTVLPIKRNSSLLATASPDGSLCLVIDRSQPIPEVRLFKQDGTVVGEWSPNESASPEASPAPLLSPEAKASPEAATDEIRVGDRISWKRDGSGAVVSLSGVGVFLADAKLAMTEILAGRTAPVTAVAWSPSEQSIAMATWNGEQRSAAIVTVGVQSLGSAGTRIFALPEGDGRYIRSLAWGAEKVGLVFALRSATSNSSLPNDLYVLPRFGQSMRLLAPAAIDAPVAVVDQVAIASNGSTVAFTVLIPSGAGLRFNSAWVTDVLSPEPVRADTTGIRRVNEIEWTTKGLVISGTRRVLEGGASYQLAVVEHLSTSEPTEIAADRSEATPIASPAANIAATPEASPVSP